MAKGCIHAKLQLQLVVPEDWFVRGESTAWYKCLNPKCGAEFGTELAELRPMEIVVETGSAA